MLKLVKKKQKLLSIKDHFDRKNKILIKRRCGGFGDTLMVRMLFEDIKSQLPDYQITFTCPHPFSEMAKNHPYVETIDLNLINESEYGIIYDISTACRVHESKYGKLNTTHRSDIWAKHCGIKLSNHEMHLTPPQNNLTIHNPLNKPIILFTPFSTQDEFGKGKSLTYDQIREITYSLKDYLIITLNSERHFLFDELGIQQFIGLKAKEWIGLVNNVDCIISVDTATFHLAGGLKKPLIGIFGFTNGRVYGKYYDFILIQKQMDCSPCFSPTTCPKSKEVHKPCLTEITSSEVVQAVAEASNKWQFSRNDPKTFQNVTSDS